MWFVYCVFFFFQAEDGIRDYKVTGVQTCALPISGITTLPVVPGRTVLRTTTTNGFVCPARALPSERLTAWSAVTSREPLARPGVPTQTRATSESSTASFAEVVARR